MERPGSLVGLACDHCRRHDAAGHESDAGMPEALNVQRIAPRMALRASYRIGMSEVGANALAPAGGASGLAIGDWVLHRESRTWSWLVERTAEFFVFTSPFNVGAVAVLGWLGAAGVLTSGVSPLFSFVPAFAATVAIAVALALIPRLAQLKARQRRRRVHSWTWWLLELGVAAGSAPSTVD